VVVVAVVAVVAFNGMERNFTCVPRKPICLEHELQTNSLEQSS